MAFYIFFLKFLFNLFYPHRSSSILHLDLEMMSVCKALRILFFSFFFFLYSHRSSNILHLDLEMMSVCKGLRMIFFFIFHFYLFFFFPHGLSNILY